MNRGQAPYAIGLDVGGTKIAGGVVAIDTGQVLARRRIPTHAGRGGEAVLADAIALAEALCADADGLGVGVYGIGVGVPELVDLRGRYHQRARDRMARYAGAGAVQSRLARA